MLLLDPRYTTLLTVVHYASRCLIPQASPRSRSATSTYRARLDQPSQRLVPFALLFFLALCLPLTYMIVHTTYYYNRRQSSNLTSYRPVPTTHYSYILSSSSPHHAFALLTSLSWSRHSCSRSLCSLALFRRRSHHPELLPVTPTLQASQAQRQPTVFSRPHRGAARATFGPLVAFCSLPHAAFCICS